MQKVNIRHLKKFLYDTNMAGFTTGDEKQWIKESNGSTTIPFQKGKWRSHDNFFGGEPYGGRNVVFYNDQPVWIMVYYGWVKKGNDPNMIYPVLRNALKNMPYDHPYRGPEIHEELYFTYKNSWDGTIERFSGEENIHKQNILVYSAKYIGGLVDLVKAV